MTTVLIIGSGPAAAGAALALSRREDVAITVIDIGVRLDAERQQVVERLASSEPAHWEASLVERVSAQPVSSGPRGVPEKRSYGSDYPFRNVGQLDGLTAAEDVTTSLISAAYGGFSTVWGSQVMPFMASAFDTWPFDAAPRCGPTTKRFSTKSLTPRRSMILHRTHADQSAPIQGSSIFQKPPPAHVKKM